MYTFNNSRFNVIDKSMRTRSVKNILNDKNLSDEIVYEYINANWK